MDELLQRERSEDGNLAEAIIDGSSIATVRACNLVGFKQCHFFAGILGWPYALKLAGWPEHREVWTGSCPCQPFSNAGRRKGTKDERHLWPEFLRLITARKPATIFGEQVTSPAGREWLAGVRTDLEALGYDFGAADLCAASVGAPHIRQRLFWAANAKSQLNFSGLEHDDGRGCGTDGESGRLSKICSGGSDQRIETQSASPRGAWDNYDTLPCLDGKARRVESGVFPLAHGVPGRVGLLRGYGNVIVPQLAAEFIKAYLETES